MNNKYLIGIAIIIILVLAGAIWYNNQRAEQPNLREEALQQEEQRPKVTINTKHQYRDGRHVFLGTLELPSPCHSYNAEVVEKENETEIALTTNEPAEGEVCAQVITERQFRVAFEGEQDANVIATLNGEVVNFNIFEVGPDEDIENVDIFIKG